MLKSMKKFFPIMFAIITFAVLIIFDAEIKAGETVISQEGRANNFVPASYSNHLRNYVTDVYGSRKTSFLGKLPGGEYQAVVFCGGKIYIEWYDRNYQVKSTKEIELELPLWGGAYLGETFNYIVCGKNYNSEAENGGEVYRIIKYDKNFERIASISLNSNETYTAIPFEAGNVSIDESGSLLTVYTSRQRRDGHQSNIAIRINTDDMTVHDNKGMISFPDVHVSHSFRQVFQYDNGTPVYVDVSDAYPKRSFFIQSEEISTSILDIEGQDGHNVTMAELSGLAISDANYLVVGSYVNRGMNNIFVACVDKKNGEVQRKWLTDSTFYAPKYVHNPRITQIGDNRFVIMWGSNDISGHVTDYIIVDGKGNIVSELKRSNISITDCEPIYDNGKILWLSANNGTLEFNEINDFSENGTYTPQTGQTKSVNPWDGTVDTGWYDSRETAFHLSTPQQLAGLAQLVNNGNTFEGKKIYLDNDIFMNDESYQYEWTPIAYSGKGESSVGERVFQGTFHGNCKTIYNLKTGTSKSGGVFGCIGEKGAVKCLNVSQGILNAGGCIANVNYGMISFCNNYSSTGDIGAVVGGICNNNYNLVYGCKNFGVVWGATPGGIVGCNKVALAVVSQCSNHGFVEATSEASGIIDMNFGWVYNCYNKGVISDGYIGNINRARNLCGIVHCNVDDSTVENCYSAGVFSYSTKDGYGDVTILGGIYPVCMEDYRHKVNNCYTTLADPLQEKDASTVVSYQEMRDPDFVAKLDQQTHSVLSVWLRDTNGINGGLPITVADYSYGIGQCKIQPELWISNKNREADIKDKEYQLDFECYYNDTDPIVTVENTDIAEISNKSEKCVILLKKKGTAHINIHFNETENNSSADYQVTLNIKRSEKKLLSECQIVLDKKSIAYNGRAQKPSVTVKDDNYILENNIDYTVEYKNNVNVGTAKMILTGKGDYTGEVIQTFEIKKAKQKVTYKSSYKKVYGDKPFTVKVNVESGNKKLTYTSSDKKVVTVNSKGRVTIKNTGCAVITVKAAQTKQYVAKSIRIKVSVVPQKQVIKSVKAVKGGKFYIDWKKDKRATGYQIQYSTDKNFKKGVTKVWVKKIGSRLKQFLN